MPVCMVAYRYVCLNDLIIDLMNSYVNLMKNWYQTGQ